METTFAACIPDCAKAVTKAMKSVATNKSQRMIRVMMRPSAPPDKHDGVYATELRITASSRNVREVQQSCWLKGWQPRRDSNPNTLLQRQMSYR